MPPEAIGNGVSVRLAGPHALLTHEQPPFRCWRVGHRNGHRHEIGFISAVTLVLFTLSDYGHVPRLLRLKGSFTRGILADSEPLHDRLKRIGGTATAKLCVERVQITKRTGPQVGSSVDYLGPYLIDIESAGVE
jgi:hypothetical protein